MLVEKMIIADYTLSLRADEIIIGVSMYVEERG